MTPEQITERNVFLELNRNESRIIAERMRALLTFHGLLFAAVGVAASQRLFILALVLAPVGALLCIPWSRSVSLSYKGCEALGKEYAKRKPADAPNLDAYSVDSSEFKLLPEVFIPKAIGVTWVLVLTVLDYYFCCPSALPTKP
jgi:hypothetical protein